MNDELMTEIVRRARCLRCEGIGIFLVSTQDHLWNRIPGKIDKVECQECDGNGIKLGLCRTLSKELNGQ